MSDKAWIFTNILNYPLRVSGRDNIRVDTEDYGAHFTSSLYDGDLLLVQVINKGISWADITSLMDNS